MSRLHFTTARQLPNGLWLAVCGRQTERATPVPSATDCGRCKTILAGAIDDSHLIEAQVQALWPTEADQRQAALLAKAGCNCGHCQGCKAWLDLDLNYWLAPYEDSDDKKRRYPWDDVQSALRWLVVIRQDGYASRSALAWCAVDLVNQPGTAREGQCGPDENQRTDAHIRECISAIRPQGGTRTSSPAERDAQQKHTLERILGAWARGTCHWLLSPSQCLYVLRERIAGRVVKIEGKMRDEYVWRTKSSSEVAEDVTAKLREQDAGCPALSPRGVGTLVTSGDQHLYEALRERRMIPRRRTRVAA